MSTRPRHRATRPRRRTRGVPATVVAALAVTALATGSTSARFADHAEARVPVVAAKWATQVCVIQSIDGGAQGPEIFSLTSHAALDAKGWTNLVDKTSATSVAQLAGCDVVLAAGEKWGPSPAAVSLATEWFNAGHSVLTTGNDAGQPSYPLPLLIGALGSNTEDFPMGGSVPASATQRAELTPQFPSWTPGSGYALDIAGAYPVTRVASGAVCVATVAGHATWCAAVARTSAAGGRWIHLHTKIGSAASPGDPPGADAALTWLATAES